MEGVINASGQWKYSFYTGQQFTTPKEAKDRVYLHSIESRRNLKLYKNDSVRIRARCEGKVPVFTMSQGTGPTGPNSGMEAGPSGSSGPTTRSKKRKNTGTNDDSQASPSFLDAHDKGDLCPWVLYVGKDKFTQNWVVKTHKDTHTCLQSREIKHCTYKFLSEKIFEQVRVNPDIPVKAVQDQLQRELEVQISMSKAFRAKAKAEREIRGDHIAVERNSDPCLPTRVFQRIYVCLGALKLGFRACRRDLCLGDDIDLHPNSNFTFISDRQKGIIPAIKTVYPRAEHRYCLRYIHENMKQGWCGQAYKDLLWRVASATNVRDFEKCMLELKTMNPKAHEWLNKIPAEHWARSHFSGRAKSDLLLNNICEVFNGKIVGGRDKPVITLLEYIREYCMKRIVNVQGVIDKCTGPLTPTATRIMKSIKKEAHLMKVQWNGANKYQVSGNENWQGFLYKHAVAACWNMAVNDRAAPPPETWELTEIPCKHAAAASWNMALNDRATPPSETWVGRPRKKRKRSKHEDEPFVKDGKLSRKGRTITCQSCENTRHNKATCKGQGQRQQQVATMQKPVVLPVKVHPVVDRQKEESKQKELVHKKELPLNLQVNLLPVLKCQRVYVCNSSPHKWQTSKSTSVATVQVHLETNIKVHLDGNNAEGSGSACRQAQQTEPAVDQDGSDGSGAGAVIGLFVAAGEGGAGDPGGAGVSSQGSSHTRWTRRRVQTQRISPQKRTPTQPASQPYTSSEVLVSQTRNADEREMGDGVPTQSSAAGGASEWSFL
ncbi:hypothetical protein Tco_1556837 [Tanacetum coccineum]